MFLLRQGTTREKLLLAFLAAAAASSVDDDGGTFGSVFICLHGNKHHHTELRLVGGLTAGVVKGVE